jgi:hypothetical protein
MTQHNIIGSEAFDGGLAEAVSNAIQAYCFHENGMSFDADEMVLAMVGNLAFHLALIPALQTRAARKQISRNVAAMLEDFMADAAKDPEIARFRNAVTATAYDPGNVQ